MKKVIILMMLSTIAASAVGQQKPSSSSLTRQDYLQKSKTQKAAAWILLGAGTTMIVTGSITWSDAVVKDGSIFAPWTTSKGTTLTAVGFFTAMGSIPVFIIAGKNRRNAASLTYKEEQAPELVNSFLVNSKIPSLCLKI